MSIRYICNLPDDCLRPIFEQFTTLQQLQIRLTCSRFSTVIKGIFRGKRVLKVFGSVENASYYKSSAEKLNLKNFYEGNRTNPEETVSLIVRSHGPKEENDSHFLASLFPNTDHLVVYCLHLLSIDVAHLLEHLPNLTSVTLFGMTKASPKQQTQTWLRIAQLEKLERLHLFEMKNCSLPVDILPRLSQLSHFSLSDYYSGDLVPVLSSLQCQRLSLDWINCPMDDFEQALSEKNANLCERLTSLTLGQFYITKLSPMDSVELLPFICRQFTELTHLDLGFVLEVSTQVFLIAITVYCTIDNFSTADQIPLVHAAKHLSRLVSLQTLSLVVRSSALDNFIRHPPMPLPGVHTLTLHRFCICFYKDSTSRSARIHLGELFPSLEQLTVRSKCTKCVREVGSFAFGEGASKLKTVQVQLM